MKNLFVRDLHTLEQNANIDDHFAIKGVALRTDKSGGGYLMFELADMSGSIPAKWWKRTDIHCQELLQVQYGHVLGKVEDFNNKRSVVVSQINDLGVPDDCSPFELVAALPLTELRQRLDRHIASVRNTHLTSLLKSIFENAEIRRCFENAPAAKSNHHACRHGLLQHTIEVTDIAAAIADIQNTWGYAHCAERDLAVAGALLHDIGKVCELTWDTCGNGYTRRGNLLGHITLGLELVTAKIRKVPGFSEVMCDTLQHIIAAHHGKLEWGSAVPPMVAEAQIVHASDLLDAELFYMQEAQAEKSEEFAFQRKLENRNVFVRAEAIAPHAAEAESPLPALTPVIVGRPARQMLPVLRFVLAGGLPSEVSFATRRLPVLGNVAAGLPLSADQSSDEHIAVEADGLPPDLQTFVLRVRGNSMAGDGIVDGDMVIVRPQESHEPEDIVVALLRGDNEAAIKRVEKRGDSVFLISSNPEFTPIPVRDPEDLLIRGRVVARLPAAQSE